MEFLFTNPKFPFSSAVIHNSRVLEAVITGIPRGGSAPVAGGPAAEMREIFKQLDEILATQSLDKTSVASVRLYLEEVNRDIAEVNAVYVEYFSSHAPNRRAYGVDLQVGMLVEAAFVVEMP